MQLVFLSTCDVCGARGEVRIENYFPGYRLAEWHTYVPTRWQYIERQGLTLCPAHTYRLAIEKVRSGPSPYVIEIESGPGARPQPFKFGQYPRETAKTEKEIHGEGSLSPEKVAEIKALFNQVDEEMRKIMDGY